MKKEKFRSGSAGLNLAARFKPSLAGLIGGFIVYMVVAAGVFWWLTSQERAGFGPASTMPSCQDLPASDCLLSGDPFLEKLMASYGQVLSQSQTQDNITLRLDQVYADNNYILVAYTIFRPDGFTITPYQPDLTLQNQPQTLFMAHGMSMARGNDQAVAYLNYFDASSLTQSDGEIKLRFQIATVMAEKIPSTPLPSQITPSPTIPGGIVRPVATFTAAPAKPVAAQPLEQIPTSPFNLEFTAKLTPAMVMQPNQTVKTAAGTATFKKIVITPMTERLFFSGIGQEPDIRLELVSSDTAYTPGAAPVVQHFCIPASNNWLGCDLVPGTLENQSVKQLVLRRGVDVPLPTNPPCPWCDPTVTLPTPRFSPTPVVPSGPWIFKLNS